MFGLGMGELLVVLLLALLFLGPKKLPDVAATLGRAIRNFRRATSELTDHLEIDDSVKRPLRELRAALRNEPEPHFSSTIPRVEPPTVLPQPSEVLPQPSEVLPQPSEPKEPKN